MLITLTLLIATIFNMLVFNISDIYLLSLFLVVLIISTKLLVGYERSRDRYFKDVLMNIFIIVMLYYLIVYIIGIFIGFVRTGYSLTLIGIFRNLVPVILIIGTVELLRYMINRKINDNNKLLLFSTITFISLDIMFNTQLFNLSLGKDIVGIVALIIFPAISQNIFLGYTSLKFGFIPAIFYRVLMEIPEFILPIFPNFNDYMNAVITFLIPLLILYLISKTGIGREKLKNPLDKNILNSAMSGILVLFMIVIVVLTSGVFKYYAISIGSGSMYPYLKVGDIAIVEKKSKMEEININDILVFERDNIVVVHRVTEIYEDNGLTKFLTKGDNNEEVDNWVVNETEVIGIVDYKVSYIGYPTVWLSQQLD